MDGTFQRLLDTIQRFLLYSTPSSYLHLGNLLSNTLRLRSPMEPCIYENIYSFFAGTHTNILMHITRMGIIQTFSASATKDNLQRLEGILILLSSSQNQVFNSKFTLRDYEFLRRTFEERHYRRFLVEGYGHTDPVVGKSAVKDVYWTVFEHLLNIF
ncbi:uncharacterized protein ATNIH1004_005180 [Aspergillus tanneri]|uniref:Uncharacterized protein n=1 Tax=Aspergillus tanneri TaxID=1220188 RepID=A0A5M9MXC4_9EURO|nr:uncharacterized protein ATNIH1004_005180 [Aspergillus tanneri]KAA8649279.1 hypothetical protein ATNIH1004_005180 [Aspergillus tanneri]